MASGSTVSMSSPASDMTQVVASTDLVLDTDFNTARTNVNYMLQTANDNTLGTYSAATAYGLTQGGVGVNAASDGGLIYADNATGGFKRLQDDVQALCAFYGQTVRTGVGSDVADGDSITAATWNNLMLNVQDCWTNRFAASSYTSATGDSETYTSAWASSLTAEATFTFAHEQS